MDCLPSYIEHEAWEEYTQMRVRIKKPLTPRVIRQKLALLQQFKDRGHDVNAVIDAATNGHWLDFYEPKEAVISDRRPVAPRNAELLRMESHPVASREQIDAALSKLTGKLRRVA